MIVGNAEDDEAAARWYQKQEEHWKAAKAGRNAFRQYQQGWRAPLQAARLMDTVVNLVKDLITQKTADQEAQEVAQGAMQI